MLFGLVHTAVVGAKLIILQRLANAAPMAMAVGNVATTAVALLPPRPAVSTATVAIMTPNAAKGVAPPRTPIVAAKVTTAIPGNIAAATMYAHRKAGNAA